MGQLDGSVALVTGGARGIGQGIVRRLVDAGAQVMIGDVAEDEGAAFAADVGDAAGFTRLDVADASAWANAVDATRDAFGPVSVLVNNAGVLAQAPVDTTAEDEIRRVYDVNLIGPHLGMQAVIPGMREAGKGSIINIASASALIPMLMLSAYGSSKWGLRGLTKIAAMELGPHGIRVNAIHPGAIRSHMTAGLDESMFEVYALRRIGEPEDIGAAVVYLASDDSSFVTGADLAVDGGMVLGPVPPA
jgi:3alpha(or 20beta)-hydroxysteroid dehydrogenase